jgi:hypothetical protein
MGTARTLSIRKSPSVLFKIDLAKAFDSVNWVFLLELLSAVGCRLRWTNWISVLLSMASTKVLLNGRRKVVEDLQGHATVHGVSGRGVLRRAPAQRG